MPRLARLTGVVVTLVGLALIGYSIGMWADLVPGSRTRVPDPIALQHPIPTRALPPIPTPLPTRAPTPIPARPTGGIHPQPEYLYPPDPPLSAAEVVARMKPPAEPVRIRGPLRAADAEERARGIARPRAGQAVALRMPSIRLSTEVVAGGVTLNRKGEPEWETVPFVAVHYQPTALVGSHGNAVVAGHVVTLNEGNVFRNLYRVIHGDRIEVDTESATFTYVVDDVRLVQPDDIGVVFPTADARLTLVTCGGEYNPRTMEFAQRLIVVGKLIEWAPRTG
jgi:LPXTG-site transpeptidase (sortase) family protein